MSVFTARHPKVEDWQFLLDFPKSGEVELNGERWLFTKHGAGLLFHNLDTGAVVDIHKHIQQTSVFDIWRFERFVASIGQKYLCDNLDEYLDKIQSTGEVKKSTEYHGYFELVS